MPPCPISTVIREVRATDKNIILHKEIRTCRYGITEIRNITSKVKAPRNFWVSREYLVAIPVDDLSRLNVFWTV